MTIRKVVVQAFWDEEAEVWIATSDDVPGLNCEADDINELEEVIIALVPALLLANGLVTPRRRSPVKIDVNATFSAVAEMAAIA